MADLKRSSFGQMYVTQEREGEAFILKVSSPPPAWCGLHHRDSGDWITCRNCRAREMRVDVFQGEEETEKIFISISGKVLKPKPRSSSVTCFPEKPPYKAS